MVQLQSLNVTLMETRLIGSANTFGTIINSSDYLITNWLMIVKGLKDNVKTLLQWSREHRAR